MIVKTQALQVFDFLTQPGEKLYERAARFHFKALQGVLEGKADFDQEKADVFYYFPDVASALGKDILKNAQMSQCLRDNPLAAMKLLLSDYDQFNKILEPLVLGSAEATYYFLKAADEKKLSLAQAEETYLAVLLSDPFWATRRYADTKDEGILSRCLALAKDPRKSPGQAYIHLYFDKDADPSDFADILAEHPMYAYLASRHFYSRNLEFKYINIRHLSPRWAYHFITDGFLDNEEGLIQSMSPSPEWLVEYLVESERFKDIPYTSSVIEQAIEKNPSSILTLHLHRWLERSNAYAKELAAVEKAKKEAKKAQEKTK